MKKMKKFLSFVISLCVVMASVVIISQPKVVAGNWAGCSYSSGTLSVDISTSSTTISVTYNGSGKNYFGVQGYIYKLDATCNGITSVGAEVDKAVAVAGKITSYSATSSWNASSWELGSYTCTMTCYVVASNGATDSTSTTKTVTVTCSHSGGYTRQDTSSTYLRSSATCTAAATYWYKCKNCTAKSSSSYFSSGSTLAHSFTSQTTTSTYLRSAATCTDAATYWYKCANCTTSSQNNTNTYYSSGSVNSSNHTNVDADWTTTVPVTCTTNGTRVKYCRACNAIAVSETITAPGHTPVTDAAVAATCTQTGLTQGSHCSVCNTVLTAQETVPIDSTNHDYSSETKTSDYLRTAATCTADATYYYKCSRCSASSEGDTDTWYTDTGSMLAHTPGTKVSTTATCTEAGTATYTCSVCGNNFTQAETATGHTPGTKVGTTATCTEAGTATYVCSVCGLEFTQAEAALGHDWDEWEVTSPATCIAAGSKTRTCLRDSNHTETDTIAIDPDAHDIEGVDWTITTPATTSSTGTRVKYCNLCHTVAVSETIPMIVNPTAVDVSPNSSAVEVGATQQLTPTFTPSEVNNTTLTWTSSDPTVATVSSTGLVTGVAEGAVMITATLSSDNTVTDSVSVTVVPAQGGGTFDLVDTHPDIDLNFGPDTTSLTVTGTSCNASSDGTNAFNFSIALALSSTYTNTVIDENEVVAVITLDNNYTASNGYKGISGSTIYPAVADSVYIPLVEGSNTFSIVSPSYIQPDENGKVMWHVAVYVGGSVEAPKNELLYNSIVEFDNDESTDAILAVSPVGDPLVSQSATTKNINISYDNISSLSVAVEHQNPATGVYTSVPALASPVTLTSSGQNYAITINGASAMTPGTTIRLTFTAYDSSGNAVATDKCYLVASWINYS